MFKVDLRRLLVQLAAQLLQHDIAVADFATQRFADGLQFFHRRGQPVGFGSRLVALGHQFRVSLLKTCIERRQFGLQRLALLPPVVALLRPMRALGLGNDFRKRRRRSPPHQPRMAANENIQER